MTIYGRILLAGAGSAVLLVAAFAFQYAGGLVPCSLCVWQRWPHVVAVVLAVLGVTLLWRYDRLVCALGAMTMLGGAGLALYHSGVERSWWEGPSACTASASLDMPADQLLDRIMAAPMVRCDEIPWEIAGLSMANLNGFACLALALVWGWPLLRPR